MIQEIYTYRNSNRQYKHQFKLIKFFVSVFHEIAPFILFRNGIYAVPNIELRSDEVIYLLNVPFIRLKYLCMVNLIILKLFVFIDFFQAEETCLSYLEIFLSEILPLVILLDINVDTNDIIKLMVNTSNIEYSEEIVVIRLLVNVTTKEIISLTFFVYINPSIAPNATFISNFPTLKVTLFFKMYLSTNHSII